MAGERTIGAGGGFEFQSKGFPLPHLHLSIVTSGNFTFFDPGHTLREGEMAESGRLDLVSQDHFAPSRTRPFALQGAGLRPDLDCSSTLEDLRDSGVAAVGRILAEARRRRLIP